MIKVDCDTLPGHLKAICQGTHRKADGRGHSLQHRKDIIARKLGCSPDEIELPQAPIDVRVSSGIGDRLASIITREVGQSTPCGDCKDEILSLNQSTRDEAIANRKALAARIVERAKTQAPRWWQRWGAAVAPGIAEGRVLKWIDEACGIVPQTLVGQVLVALRTANREEPTIDGTLQSLAEAGFDAPLIFAEPDAPGECDVRWPEPKGSFGSFISMSRWLVDNTEVEWLLLCEDDVLFAKGLRAKLESLTLGNEVVTLFKPHGIHLSGEGFQRVGTVNGLLALLVRREVLGRLLNSKTVKSWSKHDCEDYCMGRASTEIGVPILSPVHSWVQHVGRTSVVQPVRWKDNSLTHPMRYASDFVEDLRGEAVPQSVTKIKQQNYDGQPPARFSPFASEPKRHLIYHIWPRKWNGVWQWNVAELLKRIDLFDGVRTIGIATSSFNADSIETVKTAFSGHRIDNWVIHSNDPVRGEGATFTDMLATLPGDGVTFYGHAKGVKYKTSNPLVKRWVTLMLTTCLDDYQRARRALNTSAMAGAFRAPSSYGRENNWGWQFSGTYFWFRNREVFERPEFNRVDNQYGCVETWPAQMFQPEETACLLGEGVTWVCSDETLSYWEHAIKNRPTKSVSVVIPTLGRESLKRVLESLKAQLSPFDEVIVVSDGDHQIEGAHVHSDADSVYGNAQRNFGRCLATGDLIWFVDDDDELPPNAVQAIRDASIDRPTMFRMRHCGEEIWTEQRTRIGNVGGPMLVVPNSPELPLFPVPCSDGSTSDLEWIQAVEQQCGLAWNPAVIYECHQHRKGQ